ncbi:hypothetical protein GCM10010965_22390 [Caldalkalibacillus thermarum]|uniref:glycosyltransferase family 4 protein n=1 Tax=Caldalkalibacillus thermarum TaxID=296745 RepID=UPI00166EE869|nr:glycosyltransferase family 4 protein [Caldalkalibacillus thermarum]GGK29068.1 hypothetical protein GCM10010965_22390 [Caldalkalibacillus thermarum]
MKILYIYRYLILGGVTTQLVNRLAYLRRFAEVHFAYLKDYGGRRAFGDYPHLQVAGSTGELADYINSHNFDAVIIIDTDEAYAALEQARYQGCVIHEVHTTTSNIRYLDRLNITGIDAFLAPSKYVADLIRKRFPAAAARCYITPNCLDTGLFTYSQPEHIPAQKVLLWVGKLDQHKNWPAFLAISHSLLQLRDDCQFWMIGGETAKAETVDALLEQADQYGLLSRLHWIQSLDYEDMPQVYALAAASGGLSISTSKNESFGMTVIESLACRCPALAPRVGALPEVLDGELNVCLYDGLDVQQITEKLNRLLDDQNLRNRLIDAGCRKVRSQYSIEAAGRHYFDTLNKVINQKMGKEH